MKIEIIPVREEEKLILSHLIELYEYDFSEFEGTDVNALGLYGYSYLDYYWTEKNRFPYFIRVDGVLAGFVMVCGHCYVSKEPSTLSLAEFFVLRKYRRCGVGRKAAIDVFRMHPGRWELCVHPQNPGSHKFWGKIIKEVSADSRLILDVEGVYDDYLAGVYLFTVR